MNDRAFVIAGDTATVIANDVDKCCQYRATTHWVPVGVQMPALRHCDAETMFMIEDGMLEFMVGGAAAYVTAPAIIRVPPGVHYAYRNAGEHTAHLLVRTSKPEPTYKPIRYDVESSA